MADINSLANEITRALRQYTNEVQEEVNEAAEEVATDAVDKLKQSSPERTGRYAKSWTKTKKGDKWIVHNKKHYRLTHLLEKGHAKVNGGRVGAKVHIAPVEHNAINDFIERVERAVEG